MGKCGQCRMYQKKYCKPAIMCLNAMIANELNTALDNTNIRIFSDPAQMAKAIMSREVNAVLGVGFQTTGRLQQMLLDHTKNDPRCTRIQHQRYGVHPSVDHIQEALPALCASCTA